jgi:hypothetical protein
MATARILAGILWQVLTRNNSAVLRCFSVPVKNLTKYLPSTESI